MSDKGAARLAELERTYLQQGLSLRQARRKAEAQCVREYVSRLRVKDPAEYARLQQMVQNPGFAEDERRSRRQALMVEETTRKARAARAVVCDGLPLPRIPVDAFIAFRSWNVNSSGYLQGVGAGSAYEWRELNFADGVPTPYNGNGLYAYRIDPQSLITGGIGSYFNGKCVGLVAVSGRVLEHDDGVIRAECARLLCLWYMPQDPKDAYVEVPQLMRLYPITPLYVTTRQRAAEALFRIGAALLRRREKGFGDDVIFARSADEVAEEEYQELVGMRGQW